MSFICHLKMEVFKESRIILIYIQVKILFIGCDTMEKDFIKRIVVDPKIMVGKPIIKGTRITVYEIVR